MWCQNDLSSAPILVYRRDEQTAEQGFISHAKLWESCQTNF